jgi:hypothetical protein
MGFTDRMGDVLAASDALVHSSAGLTVLEAIIRGCPVVSYGFGYGHVRASNAALERFGLAEVARSQQELGPAIARALERRPEPDTSFARRPSTASLILGDERRVRQLPVWRVRTARVATTTVLSVAALAWTMTTGVTYKLVSHFVHLRPVTAVATTRPEVGVLVDAPVAQLPTIASALSSDGIQVSFTVDRSLTAAQLAALPRGDQAVPRLPRGGLVRWLGTRDFINDLGKTCGLGHHHHFLYVSSGPSLGQWLFAHGAGGRLVAGAVKIGGHHTALGMLRPGELIEVAVTRPSDVARLVDELAARLHADHLTAVPVARLMSDAGVPV